MTKKDYDLIAGVILLKRLDIQDAKTMGYVSQESAAEMDTVCELMEDLADKFALENPLFNRDMFFKSCGLGQ
jgi:hypothetical protein